MTDTVKYRPALYNGTRMRSLLVASAMPGNLIDRLSRLPVSGARVAGGGAIPGVRITARSRRWPLAAGVAVLVLRGAQGGGAVPSGFAVAAAGAGGHQGLLAVITPGGSR